ncbi:hypothetical protein PHISP_05251 [Aspergillus sp. HF37]|nr:hypothetical protein PHISP_05251 [Aspergillus sp. HF37]
MSVSTLALANNGYEQPTAQLVDGISRRLADDRTTKMSISSLTARSGKWRIVHVVCEEWLVGGINSASLLRGRLTWIQYIKDRQPCYTLYSHFWLLRLLSRPPWQEAETLVKTWGLSSVPGRNQVHLKLRTGRGQIPGQSIVRKAVRKVCAEHNTNESRVTLDLETSEGYGPVNREADADGYSKLIKAGLV